MQASRKELVPGVYCGLVWLVHQDELFSQTQSAGVVACPEGRCSGKNPPLDGDVVMQDALILQGPDVAGQLGVVALVGVLEIGFMVPIS